MQKSRFFIFIFLFSILTLGTADCYSIKAASQNITIYLNNQPLTTSTPPFVEKGVTLIPMRLIFEALGADVAWATETQTILAKKDSTSIALTVGKTTAFIDTNKKTLLFPPKLKNGTTYVPLRFISESLGSSVVWDESTQTIFIHSNEQTKPLITPEPVTLQVKKDLSVQEVGKMTNTIAFISNNQTNDSESLGSGFVISDDGKIVTNYHVIANAKKLTISFENGKEYTDISILGYDLFKDIAILKINTSDKFPFCKLGDSNKVVLGDSIVVIGNPMGLRNTLSTGIISSLKQQDYIQITAPISPGSSGGALFNMYGEVIGIPSAGITEGENLGFCIPINEMKSISLGKSLTLAEFNKVSNTLKAPQNVKAFPLSSTEIGVQWDDDKTADYYYVYFCDTSTGTFMPYQEDNGDKTPFDWVKDYSMSNYDLLPQTTVYYKITAVKNGVESPFSQMVSAATLKDDSSSLITIVKEGSFASFSKQQIGPYFDSFFSDVKWTYFHSDKNEDIVEFTGTCTYKGEDVNIFLQFVVVRSSGSFEATYMAKNGHAMPSSELDDLLKGIFST